MEGRDVVMALAHPEPSASYRRGLPAPCLNPSGRGAPRDARSPPDVTRRLAQEAATSLTEAYLQWLERCRTLLAERAVQRAS